MNYQKVYDQLVQKNHTFSKGEYFETHHKVPVSLGGTDDKSNLVNLSAREHYIAHLLLVKIAEVGGNAQAHEKMLYAFNCMKWGRCEGERSFRFNSRLYQALKERYSKLRSRMMKTPHNPSKGKHWICNKDLKLSICIEPNALYWDYLASGWRTGRYYSEQALKHMFESSKRVKDSVWIRRKDLSCQKQISKNDANKYLETNEWEFGRVMLMTKSEKANLRQQSRRHKHPSEWVSTKRTNALFERIIATGVFDSMTNKYQMGVVNRRQVRKYLLKTGHHSCANCGKEKIKLTVHAKDGNCKNLSVDNYEFLCRECYLKSGTAGFSGRHHNYENKVLEFIRRRFPIDCHWLDGNCYYFALILLDRFPLGKILYDVIDGHFVCEIDGVKYDWSGIADESGKHHWIEWDKFNEYDDLQHERVVRDCLM